MGVEEGGKEGLREDEGGIQKDGQLSATFGQAS